MNTRDSEQTTNTLIEVEDQQDQQDLQDESEVEDTGTDNSIAEYIDPSVDNKLFEESKQNYSACEIHMGKKKFETQKELVSILASSFSLKDKVSIDQFFILAFLIFFLGVHF